MTDTDDYVCDDATGEWIPAAEGAAKTAAQDTGAVVRDSVATCSPTATT